MMRKTTILVLLFSLLLLVEPTKIYASTEEIVIKDDEIAKGKVSILYNKDFKGKVKLMIQKDGSKQTFNLKPKKEYTDFPLSMGDGNYKITVYENVSGNKYRPVAVKNTSVKVGKEQDIYLHSIQEIDWESKQVIKEVGKLLDEKEKNLGRKLKENEKTMEIYQIIVQKIQYDHEKISKIKYDYLPNIDETYKTEKGICYDYSSLFASILRSQKIPTKLVKGYAEGVTEYHAWNEVYLDNSWKVVDTTVDAAYFRAGHKTTFEKPVKDYKKTSEI